MVQSGSNPVRPLALLPGVVLTLLGIGAMMSLASRPVALAIVGTLGFRGFLAVSEALLPLPSLLFFAFSGASLRQALALVPLRRGGVVLCVGLGVALWLASLGLLELQYTVWPPGPEYIEGFRRVHELLRPSGPLDAVVSLFAIAVLPAVCEETAIRGVLLPALRTKLVFPLALVLSAAVFALMHDSYRMPFTFAVGLVLGALRLHKGSLLPSMLAHASLNALTFAAAPFLDDPTQPLPDPRPLLGLALLVAGSWGTYLLWRRLPESRS
ncbi:MAG TPA: CPBP family intramembrane glutamic endopeptidase [Vicinamibacteria bacterium]|nr:CPBP family intramembrane glutamic endopeptidase [Vicinamibacteria bacterium]